MKLQKILPESKTRVSAWYFNTDTDSGISLGAYNKGDNFAETLVYAREINGKKQLVINESMAKKFGFEIVKE